MKVFSPVREAGEPYWFGWIWTDSRTSPGVEEKEDSNTVGGKVNWNSHHEEQYGGSLKN